ncbi:Putative mitochondrial aspartate [Trichuris trichiura]|uniref:Putative mitochondrial aspartate n=1 Tax=Trichuris trichiura TaxID=36087 RepID=A0A077YUZ7_TRITR|nr:Putative mitochondrial aspartate [Trichuris trichiura]
MLNELGSPYACSLGGRLSNKLILKCVTAFNWLQKNPFRSANAFQKESISQCIYLKLSAEVFFKGERRDLTLEYIISYENRIRMFSSANKVFRYFASVKILPDESDPAKHAEVFMTPYDFLRSLTPGMPQPEGQFGFISFFKRLKKARIADNLFSKNVLISFPEYIFLLTVLSASPEKFALAFKVFDLDNDGMLDYYEFNKVKCLAQRFKELFVVWKANYKVTAFKRRFFNIFVFFFKFAPFFGDSLGFPSGRHWDLDVTQISDCFWEICSRVTFQDVEAFFLLLSRMDDVETALRIHRLAESSVDRTTLKRVINLVTDRPASECVVEILFAMFDANADDALAYEEFIKVMKCNVGFGLGSNRTPKLTAMFDALRKCLVWQVQVAMSRWCGE